MFKNVTKEIKSLFKTFNKLKLPVKLLILAAVVFVVYKYVHKSRILGFSFQNSLHVTEGFGSKTLTYYRMEGCPHCKRFDEDGWPDFAKVSDFGTSQLYWNNGNGTFTEDTKQGGLGVDDFGMGNAVADVNGDGRLDLFVTSI